MVERGNGVRGHNLATAPASTCANNIMVRQGQAWVAAKTILFRAYWRTVTRAASFGTAIISMICKAIIKRYSVRTCFQLWHIAHLRLFEVERMEISD